MIDQGEYVLPGQGLFSCIKIGDNAVEQDEDFAPARQEVLLLARNKRFSCLLKHTIFLSKNEISFGSRRRYSPGHGEGLLDQEEQFIFQQPEIFVLIKHKKILLWINRKHSPLARRKYLLDQISQSRRGLSSH